MRETIQRICRLQPAYSSANTPEMQERGRLVRQTLRAEIRELAGPLGTALGEYGTDFLVDASDGIGRKTELPWVRFCSERMSPSATEGFYCVLHFSTDGSGVNIAVGCSSSRFHEGYSVVLPPEELSKRTAWARQVVREKLGGLGPFTDPIDFGATRRLPKSFQDATAFVKKVPVVELDDDRLVELLVEAARMLRVIYQAQREGRELSPADQVEMELLSATRPRSTALRGQGFGLTKEERKAVENRAMTLTESWLKSKGYAVKDTSANHPYDFEASKGGERLFVEVKGTTSDAADAIMMTHGEVDLHRREKGATALFLVSGIRLERQGGGVRASGGELEALLHWDIDEWMLKATAFRVSRR